MLTNYNMYQLYVGIFLTATIALALLLFTINSVNIKETSGILGNYLIFPVKIAFWLTQVNSCIPSFMVFARNMGRNRCRHWMYSSVLLCVRNGRHSEWSRRHQSASVPHSANELSDFIHCNNDLHCLLGTFLQVHFQAFNIEKTRSSPGWSSDDTREETVHGTREYFPIGCYCIALGQSWRQQYDRRRASNRLFFHDDDVLCTWPPRRCQQTFQARH